MCWEDSVVMQNPRCETSNLASSGNIGGLCAANSCWQIGLRQSTEVYSEIAEVNSIVVFEIGTTQSWQGSATTSK